ncbi:MAG: CRP/FNR family cyclic AMP-dependent transcriptional regulator [Desulforhopalus sp.]|jgi:CRP/FNR family cyclic AMP-dependent transcriptional regulator
MGFPKIIFAITENNNCPLYEYSDAFELSGIAIPLKDADSNSVITTTIITHPNGKRNCKILDGDLSRLIINYERSDKIPVCMMACTGCTGSIKLEYSKKSSLSSKDPSTLSDEIGSMMHLLSSFPFFKNIDSHNLDKVVGFFKLRKYQTGDIVIRKGDPGGRLFIIVSGSINVLNNAGIIISVLDKGEVFGEMSLICNDAVTATIQVKENATILDVDQPNFHKIIDIYPDIQLYFSRIMAERLNRSNAIRAEDLSSGIVGDLKEIPAEALFQTLNMNNKTGILTITDLSKGTARFSFRQGALIKAKYNNFAGDLAFYEILKEETGRFRFTPGIAKEDFDTPEIGFFMKLLMEGLRRLDENKGQKTN